MYTAVAPRRWILDVYRPPVVPAMRAVYRTSGIPTPSAPAVIIGGSLLAVALLFGATKQST